MACYSKMAGKRHNWEMDVDYTFEAWEMTVKDVGADPATCISPVRFEILENTYERGNTARPGHDIYRIAGYGADDTECFRLDETSEWSFDPKTVDKRFIRDMRQVRLLKVDGEWQEFSFDRLAR